MIRDIIDKTVTVYITNNISDVLPNVCTNTTEFILFVVNIMFMLSIGSFGCVTSWNCKLCRGQGTHLYRATVTWWRQQPACSPWSADSQHRKFFSCIYHGGMYAVIQGLHQITEYLLPTYRQPCRDAQDCIHTVSKKKDQRLFWLVIYGILGLCGFWGYEVLGLRGFKVTW